MRSKEIENLSIQIKSLTDERTKLLYEVKNLTEQVNNLLLEKARLEAVVKNLTAQVNSLTAENERLRNEITSLQNQIAYLNSRITDLENRVRVLEDIVYLRVRIVLDKDKTVNIAANSYITLRYDTRYAAGYLRISFTATRDIYIWIANDYVGGYYYRYPVPTRGLTYASSGSFIVPVLPGTTYIEIYNPSWFSGVTVTITIEYIY